jgi:hypothetical protein
MEGGGYKQNTTKHKTTKHFRNYVVTSRKFRLPTWRLHTTKPYNSKLAKHRLIRSGYCKSKWFSQRPLLNEKQWGMKKIGTYVDCDVVKLLCLLLNLWSARWSFVANEAWSGCWNLCWDDINVVVVVVVVVIVVEGVIGAGTAGCRYTIIAKHRNAIQAIWTATSFHH